MNTPTYAIVVPTIGRTSLHTLLELLTTGYDPAPDEIVIVDDRPNPNPPLTVRPSARDRVRVVRSGGSSGGRGPAAARNAGWRTATADWIVFLDDDVFPAPGWHAQIVADLTGLPGEVAGTQGTVRVPMPTGRRPTDWERGTAGLADAAWITADMAYRRTVLVETGGFDERFRRAYREDADLTLRVRDAGYRLVRGSRRVTHPVRQAGFWVSVRAQAGNADDVLMRRLHGTDWRERAGERRGRFRKHAACTIAGVAGLGALVRRRSAAAKVVSATALAAWAGLTAEFAVARIAPGPRTPAEISRMVVTSVVIPPVAVAHKVRGLLRYGRVAHRRTPTAVLFDRDDTLIRDVPYNGDPERVEPMPGARTALDLLRRRGVKIGVVSNQSGVAKGHITAEDVRKVNARAEQLLGPFDVWEICPHDRADGCGCRKPKSGLIERAARRLHTTAAQCVVVGDIGSDVEAATAAGARAILVPTARTCPDEVRRAPEVAADLTTAVRLALRTRAR
jgi:HAD superfamily hydrolase (TIGR01662 family)